MITTLVFAGSTTTKLEDVDEISDHVGRPNTLVWVDLVEATDDDLRCLQDEFSLHPLALEDVREYGQRPKLELYPTHAFIIGYAHDADSADLPEVDMFVGPNWLITARSHNERGELFDIIPVRERYERLRGDSSGVGLLLSAIFRDMVDGYFDTVEASEDRLEAIEHRLFDRDDVDPAQAARADRDVEGLAPDLLHLRRELIVLRRKIVPLRDVVLGIIRREIPWVEDSSIVFFQDVLDHLLRVLDQIDTQRELLGNVVDANLGLIANRTNEVMKKTSSWGAILICATLVAGIYGMNFHNMPELNWRFGYFGALATMAALTAGLYLYFKRKTWL